jgi:hypothetical protein
MTGRLALYAVLGVFIVGIILYIVLSNKSFISAEGFEDTTTYNINNIDSYILSIVDGLQKQKDRSPLFPPSLLHPIDTPSFKSVYGLNVWGTNATNISNAKQVLDNVSEGLLQTIYNNYLYVDNLASINWIYENQLKPNNNAVFIQINPRYVNQEVSIPFYRPFNTGDKSNEYYFNRNLELDQDVGRLRRIGWGTLDYFNMLSDNRAKQLVYSKSQTMQLENVYNSIKLTTSLQNDRISLKLTNDRHYDTIFYYETNQQFRIDSENKIGYVIRNLRGKSIGVDPTSGELYTQDSIGPNTLYFTFENNNTKCSDIYMRTNNKWVKRQIYLGNNGNTLVLQSGGGLRSELNLIPVDRSNLTSEPYTNDYNERIASTYNNIKNAYYNSKFMTMALSALGECKQPINRANGIRIRKSIALFLQTTAPGFKAFIDTKGVNINRLDSIDLKGARQQLKTEYKSLTSSITSAEENAINMFVDSPNMIVNINVSQVLVFDNTNNNIAGRGKIIINNTENTTNRYILDGEYKARQSASGKVATMRTFDLVFSETPTLSYIVLIGDNDNSPDNIHKGIEVELLFNNTPISQPINMIPTTNINVLRLCDNQILEVASPVTVQGYIPNDIIDQYVSFCAKKEGVSLPDPAPQFGYGLQSLDIYKYDKGYNYPASIFVIGRFDQVVQEELNKSIELCSRLRLSQRNIPSRTTTTVEDPEFWKKMISDKTPLYSFKEIPGWITHHHRSGEETTITSTPAYTDYLDESLRVGTREPVSALSRSPTLRLGYFIPNAANKQCHKVIKQITYNGAFIDVYDYNAMDQNKSDCMVDVRNDMVTLSLMPRYTREWILDWFYDRNLRMIDYIYQDESVDAANIQDRDYNTRQLPLSSMSAVDSAFNAHLARVDAIKMENSVVIARNEERYSFNSPSILDRIKTIKETIVQWVTQIKGRYASEPNKLLIILNEVYKECDSALETAMKLKTTYGWRTYYNTFDSSNSPNRILRGEYDFLDRYIIRDPVNERKNEVKRVVVPPPFDFTKRTILDSIAQQFYELLNGRYMITMIYDISTIGTSQFDLRFDVAKHNYSRDVEAKINALTEEYVANLTSSTTPLTANAMNDMRIKYYDDIYNLQQEQNTHIDLNAFGGMMGKFFYKKINDEKIEITGFTLEDAAAHSFFPNTNGGLEPIDPINGRQVGGILNYYAPKTLYTKNKGKTIDFTEKNQQILTMFDYMEAVAAGDLSGALVNAPNDQWDLSGEIKVTEVLSGVQISPYQGILEWREDVINLETNTPYPGKAGITRRAIITYRNNEEEWFANETVFDAKVFLFIANRSVDACIFKPEEYRYTFTDMIGKSDEEIEKYYTSVGIREGLSPCPISNPGARFDIELYKGANTTATSRFVNNDDVISYYKTTGVRNKQIVIPAKTLPPQYNPPRIIPYVLPADYGLDTGDDICPPTNCSNPDIIKSLVKQYNESPDMSGNILRVIKATTPSPYQCDLEVWMDMVSKEKGVQIPAGSTGTVQTKLSMYVGLDKNTCDFNLGGIGSNKDPSTVIDDKTPQLSEPVDYAKAVKEEQAGAIQYAFDSLGSLAAGAFNAIKSYMKEYRLTTFAAVGDLTTLDGCPQKKCNDPYIMDAFIRLYESKNWQRSRIKQILRTGTYDGLTCDYTYEIEPIGLTNEGKPAALPIVTTTASRVKLQKEAGSGCVFRVVSEEPVYPSPSWDQIRDLSNTQFDRTNEFNTLPTINYINRRPIRYVDCGGAKALNQIAQFDNDIVKVLAIKNAFVNQCIAEVQTFNNKTQRLVYTFDIDENNEYKIAPYLEGQLLTNRKVSENPVRFGCDREPEVYIIDNTDTGIMNFRDYDSNTGTFANNTANVRYASNRCGVYGGRLATVAELNSAITNGMTLRSEVYLITRSGDVYDMGLGRVIPAKNVRDSLMLSSVTISIACFGKKPDQGAAADVTQSFGRRWAYGELITHTANDVRTCTWCPPGVSLGGAGCVSRGTASLTKPLCTAAGETVYVGRDGPKCYVPCTTGIPIGFICAQQMPNTDITNLLVGNVRTNINVSFTNLLPETLLPTTDCEGKPINKCLDPSGAMIQYFDCNQGLMQCNTCSVTEVTCAVEGQASIDPMVGAEFYGQRVYALERIDKSTCKAKVLNAQEDLTAPTYGDIWKFFRFYQEADPVFQGTNCTIKLNKIDAVGCTNVLDCTVPRLDPVAGTLFNGVRVYASKQVDANTCEVRVLNDADAAQANSYSEIYKRMRFEQNLRDCVFYYKGLTPAACTKSVNCFIGDLDRVAGADFYGRRVYRSEQVDQNTCRVKVMNDTTIAAAPATTSFGDTTELVRFRTNTSTCTIEEVDKAPAQCTQPPFVVPTTIDPVAGVDLYGVRVYDALQIGPMIVEARVLNYAAAANSFVYGDIYKIIRFKYDKTCRIVEDARYASQNSDKINLTTAITTKPPIVQELSAVQPDIRTASVPADGKFKKEFDDRFKYNTGTPALMKKMMELTRNYIINDARWKDEWVLGAFSKFAKDADEGFVYEVTLARKYGTPYVYRWDKAYIRVVFRRGAVVADSPVVESVVLLSGAPAGMTFSNLTTNPNNTPSPNSALPTTQTYRSKYIGTSGEYAKMHTFLMSDPTIRAKLIQALRTYIAADSTKRLGKIVSYFVNTSSKPNIILFKANYAEVDADGFYRVYYSDAAPAVLEATFNFTNGPDAPPIVTAFTIKTSTATFTALSGTDVETALPTPVSNLQSATKYKQIKFIITAVRFNAILQLFTFQLFKNGTAIDPSTYTIRDTASINSSTQFIANIDPRNSSVSASDTLTVFNKSITSVSKSTPIILYIQATNENTFLEPDSFSFVTGNDTKCDPTKWIVTGIVNMTGKYEKVLVGSSTNSNNQNLTNYNSGFTEFNGTSYATTPYIFYRYPIVYFRDVTVPTNIIPLQQLEDRPYTYDECLSSKDININDIRLIRYAANTIYKVLSMQLSEYNDADTFINRYYLKGIDSYEVKKIDDTTQIIYRPILIKVSPDYKISSDIKSTTASLSTYFSSGTFPGIKLIFKLRSNCSPVLLNGGGDGEIVADYATAVPIANQITYTNGTTLIERNVTVTTGQPFGWGGITIETTFQYTKYPGYTITNIGGIMNTLYIESQGTTEKNIVLNTSGEYGNVAESGAAMVCSATNSCLGFIQTGPTAGFFAGTPTADTRLVYSQSTNIFIKNNYIIFNCIRLTISGLRTNTQTRYSFNKLKFYLDNTNVPATVNPLSYRSSTANWRYYILSATPGLTSGSGVFFTPSNTTNNIGTVMIDGNIDCDLEYSTTETTQLVILYSNPIIANKYSIITNSTNKDNDILKWKIEHSIYGANWKVWDDKSKNITPMSDDRRAEVIFTPTLNTHSVVVSPNPSTKTLNSCNKTALDIIFIREAAKYVYNSYNNNTATDEYINRYFLKDVAGYRVDNITNNDYVIVFKPTIQQVSSTITINEIADDSNLLFIEIYFSISNDCQIVIDSSKTRGVNRYNWTFMHTFTTQNNIILTSVTTQPSFTDNQRPLGWGGLQNIYTNIKSGVGLKAPQNITVTQVSYVNSSFPDTLEGRSISSSQSLATLLFSKVNDENIIGFEYDSTTQTGSYITGTLVPKGTDNISKTLYLRSDIKIFKKLSMSTNLTVNTNIGKILLYINNKLVSRSLEYTITTTGTIDSTGPNWLNLSNISSTYIKLKTGQTSYSITATFTDYIIANRYTLMTANNTTYIDLSKWATYTDTSLWDNKIATAQTGTTLRSTEFYSFPATSSYTGITFTYASIGDANFFRVGESMQDMNVIEPMDSLVHPLAPNTSVQYLRFQPIALGTQGKSLRLGKLAFFGPAGLIMNVKGAAITTLNGTDRLFERAGAPTAAAVFDYNSLESEWMDSGLGTLLIALPTPQQLTAFALLTGSDPAAAPVQWRLEGSADGRSWAPLHTQVGSPATLPTTPFTQSLVYSFDAKQAPRRIPSLFETPLAAAGKRCDDPSLLEAVHYEMATDATPRLFNPIDAKAAGAMCEYRQADDTTVRVAFQTDLTGSSRVKALEVLGTPRQRATSWEEEDFGGGRGLPTRGLVAPPRIPSPLEGRGFGQSGAPEISSLQEVFTLPLKQADGFVDVYSPQITQKQDVGTTVKYVRFRCTKTRGGTTPSVALGSFALWARQGQQLELRRAKASNPMGKWAGTVEDLAESNPAARGFKDSAGTPLVIAFPEPVPVAGFSWKTPSAAGTELTDPVRWKLEGSANGTYWFTLHEQTRDYGTPMERGWRLPLFWFDGKPPLFR